jgi:hypothetical protein
MDPPFDVRLSGGGLVDFLAPPLSPLSVVPVVLLLTDFCFALMREKSTRKKGEREMCVERKRKRFSQKLRFRRTRGEKSESARERETKRFFLNLLPRRARANVSNFTRAKKHPPVTNATKLNVPCSRQISVLRMRLYPFFPSPRG